MKKRILCLTAAAALLLLGCGSGNYAKDSVQMESIISTDSAMNTGTSMYESNADYSQEWEAETEGTFAEEGNAGQPLSQSGDVQVPETNRKLIKNVDLSVETQEFDKLIGIVENKTAEYGGYIERMQTYNGSIYTTRSNKSASLMLRIPKEKLSGFLAEVGKAGNITSRSESVEDVTLSYVDMESHKKVLQAQQERLLGLLEQAQTVEDMIILESRLSDIRYQIESMESQLRTYDNQVDYSTVYLDITEVAVLTPQIEEETVWQRIGNGFMNSMQSIGNGLQEIFIWLVVISPYLIFVLLLAGLITGIVVGSVKLSLRKKKKGTKQKENKAQD